MKSETARREIESLDYYLQNHTNDYSEESHTAMMMAIDALSNSEKPNEWIPVSEGLPEKSGFYLVSTIDCITIMEFINGWISQNIGSCNWYVKAWMPLPEPYKAESEGKE